jgi:N-succinyldiaminopimelate aminotransferase
LTDSVYSTSRLAQKAGALAGKVYRLHIGDTYLDPPACSRSEAQRTDEQDRLHNYAPVHGEPRLLDAIVTHHGGGIDRDRLQVTVGATGGLAVVCKALLDAGDEVIILAPYWPLIRGIVASVGAVPVELPFYDRFEAADAGALLAAAITDRTVAIYVNTPNNPTGRILPDDVVAAIASAARSHDLWVLSDEAYDGIWFGDAAPAPLWTRDDLAGRTIAVHTFSKNYGLAGGRVGYVHGPESAMRAIRGVQTFHTYCAPRPMQIAAARALTEASDWVADVRRAYRDAGFTAADALGVPRPEGGTFLFFDAAPYIDAREDVFDFVERCLDAGVLVTAGHVCGRDYATWVRLCYTVVPQLELEDAVGRIRGVMGR